VVEKHETCAWTGHSGAKYTYLIYPRHPSLGEGQDGNYIYTKLTSERYWVPIYIGQGDLSQRATADHHKIKCIDNKGATHIHLHLNAKEFDRLREEKDLLENYTNAYAPNGCNVKKGG
jgi:hypothetical protein